MENCKLLNTFNNRIKNVEKKYQPASNNNFEIIDTFYYEIYDNDGNNKVEFLDVYNDNETTNYKGFALLKILDLNYTLIPNSLICFEGARIVKQNQYSDIQDNMYLEYITLKIFNEADKLHDLVEFLDIYFDNGDSFITTRDYITFSVACSSGKYQGSTHVKIYYDNEGNKDYNPNNKPFFRKIEILKLI